MKPKIPLNNNFAVKRGDLIFSNLARPNPNAIISPASLDEKPFFRPQLLESYLQFLESIVINERLVLTDVICYDKSDKKLLGSEFIKSLEYWSWSGSLDIEEDLVNQLYKNNILKVVQLNPETYSPKSYIRRYLKISKFLQEKLQHEEKSELQRKKKEIDFAKQAALLVLATEYGSPIAISEFARDKGVPYMLGEIELNFISKLDNVEIDLSRGIISHLKKRLDENSQNLINQLSKIATPLIFPKTPIAWTIIRDSNKPEDLIQVALQVRKDFSNFRKDIISLEEELFDDNTTIHRKQKILYEIDLMAKGLWSEENLTHQKISQEIANLINLIPSDLSFNPAREIPNITSYLLTKPINSLIAAFHTRKIKVLLKAQKDYMRSKLWIQKLSKVFSFPEDDIRNSL